MAARSQRIFVAVIVGLLLLQAVVAISVPKGPALTASAEVIDVLLHLVAATAFIWNARNSAGRMRLFWSLQAVCWGVLTVTSFLWTYHGVVLHQEVPSLFVGDIFMFLSGVPMLAGLLLRPHQRPGHTSPLGFLDLPLLILWWLFLYFFFVTPWQYVVPDELRYGPAYNLVVLAQDLVALGLLAWLWLGRSGRWRRFYGCFFFAQVMSAGAAFLANRAIDTALYYPGSWYDVLVDLAVSAFAITAVVGRGLLPESSPDDIPDLRAGRVLASVAMVAVVSIPALAAWAVLSGGPPEVVRFRVLVALGTITLMGCLIFVKQHGLGEELARTNHILHEASLTDPLTGCRNRRFFDSTIEADVNHVLRCYADQRDEQKRDLIFYLIDADHFKDINDRFGHDVGDKFLVEMVRRISSAIRLSDVLVRWGGEEFLVLSRYTNRDEAEILANRLLAAIGSQPFAVSEKGPFISQTCSIGWAAFPFVPPAPDAFSCSEVLGLADRALYEAKQSGRNRVAGMRSTGQAVDALTR